VKQPKSLCLVLGILWALLIPRLALADDDENGAGRSCAGASASHNPQCAAPEVPIAALYPAVGGLSFAAIGIIRARRRSDGE
jgi:hypothetical protein